MQITVSDGKIVFCLPQTKRVILKTIVYSLLMYIRNKFAMFASGIIRQFLDFQKENSTYLT